MGSIVHRSVPTNLKWFPTCSHAHAMFQDRFKDVQVGSRWFSTLYILSPNFHNNSHKVNNSSSHRGVLMVGWHCHYVESSIPLSHLSLDRGVGLGTAFISHFFVFFFYALFCTD